MGLLAHEQQAGQVAVTDRRVVVQAVVVDLLVVQAVVVALAAVEVGRGTNANQVNVWIANFTANLQDALQQNNHQLDFQTRPITADSCPRNRSNRLHINRLATSQIIRPEPQ